MTGKAMEKALAHYSAKMRKEKETARVRGDGMTSATESGNRKERGGREQLFGLES